MSPIFLNAFVYLLCAVIAVPIAKRLGLSSVLGYLVAGTKKYSSAPYENKSQKWSASLNSIATIQPKTWTKPGIQASFGIRAKINNKSQSAALSHPPPPPIVHIYA